MYFQRDFDVLLKNLQKRSIYLFIFASIPKMIQKLGETQDLGKGFWKRATKK